MEEACDQLKLSDSSKEEVLSCFALVKPTLFQPDEIERLNANQDEEVSQLD
jgi:hypothetical protein